MTDLAFNLIMDCGQAMLANGGEVFRAQDTMEIMARSFGIVDFHVYVLTNGIFASAQNGTVSAVRHVPAQPANRRQKCPCRRETVSSATILRRGAVFLQKFRQFRCRTSRRSGAIVPQPVIRRLP